MLIKLPSKIKATFFLIVICGFLLKGKAQNNIDSLISISQNHKVDTVRFEAYNQLITHLTYSNTNEALAYANKLKLLAEKAGNYRYQAIAAQAIGNQYFLQGNFAMAMEHYLIALRLMEDHNMADKTAGLRHNLGNIHVRWQHPEKALKFFNEARALNIANNKTNWLINNLMSIGIVHSDLYKNNDSAIYYHNLALELSRKENNSLGIINSLVNLSTACINLDNFEDAQAFLEEALTLQQQLGVRNNLGKVYEKLGLIAFQQGNFNDSEEYYLMAYKEFIETQQFDYLAIWNINMGNLKAAMGQNREAYEYVSVGQQLNDSTFSFKEKNRLAELEAQYEIANANKEVELARRDAIIAEQKQQKSEIQKRFSFGVGIGALTLAALIFGAYRINRRNLKLLAVKSDEINLTNNMLAQANHNLHQLVEEKNNILHIVAHDLRTPLAKVRALSDLLRLNPNLDDKQLQKLNKINDAVEESSTMMQDLLDAKSESIAHKHLVIENIKPKIILDDIIAHYKPNAKLKKLKISASIAVDSLQTDAHRFKRIADNLLSNAIKYTPEGGIVTVKTWLEKNRYVLLIADNGPGFTEDDKLKMFEQFQKLSAQPIGGGGSHGLGLSIVKRMVDELDATIAVRSEPGQGAAFEVSFGFLS